MDRLNRYRDIIENVLTERAGPPNPRHSVERQLIFDRARDRYLLMKVGWRDDWRVHGCPIHVDIIDDKIWIQEDGTEDGIAADLEAAGISKQDIVLAFHDLEARKHTGYAMA
jgi:XisI protein